MIVSGGSVAKARNNDIKNNVTKELSLTFEERKIIPAILKITKNKVREYDII